MKFVLIACIIIAAAGSAKALETSEIFAATINTFTPYRIVSGCKIITTAFVEDSADTIKTCYVEVTEEPFSTTIHLKIDCNGLHITRELQKDLSIPSTYPKYHYIDENGDTKYLLL